MTREGILAMVPGRELDANIEVHVKGREMSDGDWATWQDLHDEGYNHYSTDLSAAWEVVEELNGKYAFEIGRPGDYNAPDDKWQARFGMSGFIEADTAPLAICKAALLAVLNL